MPNNRGRIISGELRKRIIKTPAEKEIRPTSDYLKESIFNVLEHEICISDTNTIDICAGSGALGIEALSRGSRECVFIDNNKTAITCINENAKKLGIHDRSFVIYSNASFINEKILRFFKEERELLIFIDPPYSDTDLLQSIVSNVRNIGKICKKMIVIESGVSFELCPAPDEQVITKTYGKSKVSFLKRN
ncbi:MAG: 16S rRNA (guanine(966)-N(2))-methyltransferase RsmD [Holosporales bacterium]|jgi:16S rRNA (guanine966-N2)-methyltransferase|nr:16S rRNA (guanine(966)-N(2))-methyltransferase RsmD [Holosporales bacterium]